MNAQRTITVARLPRVARITRALVATSLALALGGCLEWVVPGEHAERGYDGPVDPLTKQPADARASVLQERFDLIQSR